LYFNLIFAAHKAIYFADLFWLHFLISFYYEYNFFYKMQANGVGKEDVKRDYFALILRDCSLAFPQWYRSQACVLERVQRSNLRS
jgi:hypothetical protein